MFGLDATFIKMGNKFRSTGNLSLLGHIFIEVYVFKNFLSDLSNG